MTSKEISEFINQPIPSKVPHKIFCEVTSWFSRHSYYYAFFAPVVMALFVYMMSHTIHPHFIMDYILLDLGGRNKITTQGIITSITPRRGNILFWGDIGPSYYNLSIRFNDGDRNINTSNFVWRRNNIPGWGVIPETLSNSRLAFGESLSLIEPFPVAVEYIPGRRAIRVAGARSDASHRLYFLIFRIVEFYLLTRILIFILDVGIIRAKRLLRKGLFAVGHIFEREASSSFLQFLPNPGPASDYAVAFIDHRGMRRVSPFIMPVDTNNTSWLPGLASKGQPVGLLYLPDTKKVIITDLWLDWSHYYDHFSSTGKPDDYAKEKATYLERAENMIPKEAVADTGVLKRWAGKLFEREYVLFTTTLTLYVLFILVSRLW